MKKMGRIIEMEYMTNRITIFAVLVSLYMSTTSFAWEMYAGINDSDDFSQVEIKLQKKGFKPFESKQDDANDENLHMWEKKTGDKTTHVSVFFFNSKITNLVLIHNFECHQDVMEKYNKTIRAQIEKKQGIELVKPEEIIETPLFVSKGPESGVYGPDSFSSTQWKYERNIIDMNTHSSTSFSNGTFNCSNMISISYRIHEIPEHEDY